MNSSYRQQQEQQRMMQEQRRRMMQADWQRQQNERAMPVYRAKQPSVIIRFISWVWTAFWTLVMLAIVAGILIFIVSALTNTNW